MTLDIQDAAQGAQIIAHINAYKHMSARVNGQSATPVAAWPTSTFIGDNKKLFFNGEGIQIIHLPAAHTDGDSIVFFRKSDVISSGDVFVTGAYPFIDLNAGGNIQGIVAGLNRIIDLCIPVYGQEGGTLVIPGHGRLSDVGDVINFREMVTIVRDRVQDMVKKNMTLDQVKAAKPTRDYDPLYNEPGAFVTGDAFVEGCLQELEEVNRHIRRFGVLAMAAIAASSATLSAQLRGRDVSNIDPANTQQAGRDANPAAKTPKDAAPIDLTGYWVSIVSEDWRFRMLTPPKGDYPNFLLTPDGTKLANAWDPAKDEAAKDHCKAYGAPNIMRVPARFHITWADDRTLKIETDAGRQTRLCSSLARQDRRRRPHVRGRRSRSGSERRCAWTRRTCCQAMRSIQRRAGQRECEDAGVLRYHQGTGRRDLDHR